MVKNLRKGSKVFVSVGGRGLKSTPGVVTSATKEWIDVKVSSGFAKGKTLLRKPKELKRRSK